MNNRIFLLWFGDNIPQYANWNVNNIRRINDNWDINFIHYTKEQILNFKDINDNLLVDVIMNLFRSRENNFTMEMITRSYRYKVLTSDYDVYLDLDCFPISNLDNFIFPSDSDSNKKTYIKNYSYCIRQKQVDNWFLSKTNRSYISITCIGKETKLNEKLVYHKFTWMNHSEIDKFNKCLKLFKECSLKPEDCFCNNILTPVEHYSQVEWKKSHNSPKVFNKIYNS